MSKNYNRSDYALNKFSASFVYSGDDGIYEITEEDFLASDPTLTAEDYERWKRFSDQSYLDIVRRDTFEGSHIVPIDDLAETALVSHCTTEDVVIEAMEPTRKLYTHELAMQVIDLCLTKIQKARYIAYYENDKSTVEIANSEGVTEQAVSKSLLQAKKNILAFLSADGCFLPLLSTLGEGQ